LAHETIMAKVAYSGSFPAIFITVIVIKGLFKSST